MSELISTTVSAEIKTSASEGLLLSHPPVSLKTSRSAPASTDLLINQPLDPQAQFSMAILRLLEVEPIDDGYSHPAEEVMENALKKDKTLTSAWIEGIYLENFKRPAMATGILRCVGRLKNSLVESSGRNMARRGLSHPDVEVREAAIRALETWGGQESVETLKAFIDNEPVFWLKNYLTQVITDLSKWH